MKMSLYFTTAASRRKATRVDRLVDSLVDSLVGCLPPGGNVRYSAQNTTDDLVRPILSAIADVAPEVGNLPD